MNPIQKHVSRFDLFAITYSSTVALGVAFLPYVSGEETRSAWLKLIVAAIPYFFMIWLIHRFVKKYSNHDFFAVLKQEMGKGVFNLVILYLIASAILSCANITQELSFLVRTFMLKNTPITVIILPFLLIIGLALHYGILTISRFVTFFIVTELILILSFLGYSFFSGYFRWMFIPPVFTVDVATFLLSSTSDIARYAGVVSILAIIKYVKKGEPTLGAMNWGFFFVMLVYVLISLAVLGTFGYNEAIHLVSPILALVQSISPESGLLERLDLLFLGFWIISFIKVMCIILWFAIYLANILWPKVKQMYFIVAFSGLFYLYTIMIPFNLYGEWKIYNFNNILASFFVPTSLLLFLLLKKKRGVSS